ncbi:MAG: T9SS type A sorting domain-containing protein [Saprospiraceae bacterium]
MRWYSTILISAQFIAIGLDAHAQYKSLFGVNSTEWVFEWHNLDFGGVDTVYVENDTIINSLQWKKIMVKNNHSAYEGGLLREDTTSGKVWYKGLEYFGSPEDTSELLSFDFSLEVNDSFDISNMYEGSAPLYSKVVATYDVNGLKYIEFENDLYSGFPFIEPYVLIEGIGGIMGVLWKQYFGGLQAQYLLCSYKDGIETSYVNKRHNGSCNLISSIGYGQKYHNRIKVYPNPSQNYLSIDNEEGILFDRFQFVNNLGEITRFSEIATRIDITQFPTGIYTLQLISSSGEMYSYSIIKL